MPYHVAVAAGGAAGVDSSSEEKKEKAVDPQGRREILFLLAVAGLAAGGASDGPQ